MYSHQQAPAPRHSTVWEGAAEQRSRWVEALVSGLIAAYFAAGLLGTIGLF